MTEPIKVSWPPMLYTDNRGQKWAVAGSQWLPVDETATLDTIGHVMLYEPPKPSVVTTDTQSWQVTSSRNIDSVYTVTKSGNEWSCTCAGFGWRRKCRHIDSQKALTSS